MVLEELGRAVAPVPYLTSAVIAVTALLALRSRPDGGAALLAALAAGRTVGVLAVPLPTAPGRRRTGRTRRATAPCTGRVTAVADAAAAEVLLVARAPTARRCTRSRPRRTASRTDAVTPLDLTRPLATVTFDGAHGRLLATGDRARAAVDRALLTGAGLLASEQLGVAEWCLAETVRHTARAHPVRPPRRLVPGAQAPDGRALAGGRLGPRRRP